MPAPAEVADAFGVPDGTAAARPAPPGPHRRGPAGRDRRLLVPARPTPTAPPWSRRAAFGRPLYQEVEEVTGRRYATATDHLTARLPTREEADAAADPARHARAAPAAHRLRRRAPPDRGGPGDLARPDDHAHRDLSGARRPRRRSGRPRRPHARVRRPTPVGPDSSAATAQPGRRRGRVRAAPATRTGPSTGTRASATR